MHQVMLKNRGVAYSSALFNLLSNHRADDSQHPYSRTLRKSIRRENRIGAGATAIFRTP